MLIIITEVTKKKLSRKKQDEKWSIAMKIMVILIGFMKINIAFERWE